MDGRQGNLATLTLSNGAETDWDWRAALTTTSYRVEQRRKLAVWLAKEVIPHEAAVRAWLIRARVTPSDVDDMIQECYCRIASQPSVDHIERPDAYFFTIARNIFIKKLKEARVVTFASISELGSVPDESSPDPEQKTAANLSSAKVRAMLDQLPERRRRIMLFRKFDELSQKEIARRVGVTESVVENELYEGLRSLARAWRDADAVAATEMQQFSSGEAKRG